MTTPKSISLWMDQLDEPFTPRPALSEKLNLDVAIMGAGYTGLWTAYYLKQQQPNLNIAIFESKFAGHGASGRNGGWLMGELAGQDTLVKDLEAEHKTRAHHLIHSIPDEVARVLKKENIDCDYQKGGVLYVAARYPEQTPRLKAFYDAFKTLGYEKSDHQWLEDQDLTNKINIKDAQAGIYSPHCASIQPAKLVRGLATTVEALDVSIYENSPVSHWKKGEMTANGHSVTADWIIPALEAYGAELNKSLIPLKKYHLPVQSLIIATEPLSDALWQELGIKNGEVFSDFSRQVTYGIRTKDNRLVFGARGSYQFGSKLRHDFNLSSEEIGLRQAIMVELFPQLKDIKISHAWGGNLSMARRFHPHMMIDKKNKFALAGGYGGEGVGASNLAGRTLADLILGKQTELTSMPWVKQNESIKQLRKWESEPIPWLGYRAVIQAFDREDKVLNNPNSPWWKRKVFSITANIMERFVS